MNVLTLANGGGGHEGGTGRGGGPRANAGAGTDKIARAVQQIAALPRDDSGRVVFPVGPVHGVTLEDLGVVQPPHLQVGLNASNPVCFTPRSRSFTTCSYRTS